MDAPPHPVIALVEDDASLLAALCFALSEEGYDARPFADGRAALRAVKAAAPRCLVIDYRLPDLDGLSLLTRLRAQGVEAPAILITSGPDERCRRDAEQAGAAIVEKPLMDGALKAQIETFLAGA